MYSVTNPATGELVEEIPNATDDEVRAAIGRVHGGFAAWRARPVAERAAIVLRAAELFAERADELAAIMTLEMGKRINEGRGEVGVVADIFRYYGERGPDLLADEPLTIRGGEAVLTKEPIGALLGVMPWNFPAYQVARFVAPNLVLGNTILLKHASICPRSAVAIERVLRDAGVPSDAYVNVFASSRQVPWMLADPRLAGVSLTGSEQAGISVAAEAGRNLKKCVLELGGSDPLIVLDTDDLDETVKVTATARMRNCGQSCNAPKRMIVLGELYDEFVGPAGQAGHGVLRTGRPGRPGDNAAPTGLDRGGGRGGGPGGDGNPRGRDAARGRAQGAGPGRVPGGDGPHRRDARRWRRTTRRSSARWCWCSARRRRRRRSRWRTTPRSDWARACSAPTAPAPSEWPAASRPEWSTSTNRAARRRICRSGGSSGRESGASWGRWASRSS